MKLEPVTCPDCGGVVRGTRDWIPGMAVLNIDGNGNAQYGGETELFWDDQTTQAGEPPNTVRLVCGNGHEWDATILDANGLGGRVRVTKADGDALPLRPAIRWVKDLHPVGQEPDPWTKLLGSVEILGASFHVEAWQVTNEEVGQVVVNPMENCYHFITRFMTEGDGETVRINDRDYFLVVTPFQR